MLESIFVKVWVISYATKAGQSFIIKEVFESRIQAVDYMQGYITAKRDYIQSWNVTELEIGDSDNCEHPESEQEYHSQEVTCSSLYYPAEYRTDVECKLCGHTEYNV